ncbi:MAG TPA: hypothetical protein VFV87_04945, partial [Pirellulaceae bacterium]|nr:hypothetical protein [Pirellulaceae bacterium]
MRPAIVRLALTFALLAGAPAIAAGQEFRIDTELFIGKQKEPRVETLTLFSGGMIYDFLLSRPEEISLFDPVRGRFTLLDPARKLRCGLSTQDVLNYCLALETHAAESKDPLFQFAASPQFTPQVEEFAENGQQRTRLVMAGKPLEYAAVAYHPEQPEAVSAFRSFTDWYARLNAMRPGGLPPGARLELNRALAERGLVPLEITCTLAAPNVLASKTSLRSRHLVTWTLSGEDRKRIERAGNYLVEFQA